MQYRIALGSRRRGGDAFYGQHPFRARQGHAGTPLRMRFQQLDQPAIRKLRRAVALPDVNNLLNRRQGSPHQNGTGDHHTGRDVPIDRQPAPSPSTNDCSDMRTNLVIDVTRDARSLAMR